MQETQYREIKAGTANRPAAKEGACLIPPTVPSLPSQVRAQSHEPALADSGFNLSFLVCSDEKASTVPLLYILGHPHPHSDCVGSINTNLETIHRKE